MNCLFIHRRFPGQFVHLVRHLCRHGHGVTAIGAASAPPIEGLRHILYQTPAHVHAPASYLFDFESDIGAGLETARICAALKREGFEPDIIIGHSGWGEILFVKDVWPKAPLLGYFEFFYHASGADAGFDPEFPSGPDLALRLRARNAGALMGLDAADWGQTPTRWQRSLYPKIYHDRMTVIHEGVDTSLVRPNDRARLWLNSGATFESGDELVTFAARDLEPYRGFHVFMRALPGVLARRPKAHVAIVGGDGVSYGRPPIEAATWRERMLAELGDSLDLRRVHFLGFLSYPHYLTLLQASAVHCYLTYPFILSWSLVEAMAAGCRILASRTAPVEEVIESGANGQLVDFFDASAWADAIVDALGRRRRRNDRLRAAARRSAVERFDLQSVTLPRYLDLLDSLRR